VTTVPDHALGTGSARAPGIRGTATGAFDALMSADTRVGLREMGLASVVLVVAGFVLYGSHIAHGSFYYDDWSNAALVAYPPHPGFSGALSEYWTLFGFRPFVALYVPAVHEIFGLHEHWFIAWSVALLTAMSATLYLALRTVGLRRVQAIAISALALVTPFPDSTTLWSTASTAHLVIVLYLLGLVVAIHAMNAPTRRRELTLHLISLALIAIAVTTYELVATVALCSVLIYVWRTSVRKALTRFVADVVVIGAALAWTGSHTSIDEVQSASSGVTHARLLFTGGLQIIARALEPLGSPPEAVVLAAAAALLVIGVVAWRLAPRSDPTRRELGRWLVIAAAGVVFAFAAWAVFIPSDPYYEPTGLGVGNRPNALAVVGLAALTFALVMIFGTLVFRRSRHGSALATGLAVVATIAIGLNYAHRTRVDIYNWDQASRVQFQVFSALHRAIPRPAASSTIYAYGFTNWPALGVPAFAASWDLNGAVKLTYRDPSLRGYPVFSPADVVCARHGMYPVGNGYSAVGFTTQYGHAYLVDVAGNTGARPLNQAQCDQALRHPAPAPSS
jgi:hypothetical protein